MKKKLFKVGLVALFGWIITTIKQLYTGNQNILNLTWQEIRLNQMIDNFYYIIMFLLIYFIINIFRGGRNE